jgi:hypothetical protein
MQIIQTNDVQCEVSDEQRNINSKEITPYIKNTKTKKL